MKIHSRFPSDPGQVLHGWRGWGAETGNRAVFDTARLRPNGTGRSGSTKGKSREPSRERKSPWQVIDSPGKWRKWMCVPKSNNNTVLSPLAHPPFINVRWMCGSPILRWNQLFLLQFSKAVRGPSQHCGRVSCGGGRAMVDASLFILLSTFCWYFVGVFQLNFSVSPVLLAKTQGFGFYFPILC